MSKSILSSGYGRPTPMGAIFIHRKDGGQVLFPTAEILWANSKTHGGTGIVEIETRSRVVRLAFSRPETAGEFLAKLHKGEIDQVREGTGPLEEESSYDQERGHTPPPVTLAIEILDRQSDGETPPSPAPAIPAPPPAQRESLGFPAL